MDGLDETVDLVNRGDGTFKFRLRIPEQRVVVRASRGIWDTPKAEEVVIPSSTTDWRVASVHDVRELTTQERYTHIRNGEYRILEDPQLRTREHFYVDGKHVYSMDRMQMRVPANDVTPGNHSLVVEERLRMKG